MGLEDVERDILREVMSKADIIKKEGESEASKIIEEAGREVGELKKEKEKSIGKTIEALQCKESEYINLQIKKIVLEEKKKILDSVYAEVEKKIKKLSAKEREEITCALIKNAMMQLPDAKYIYSSKADSAFVKKNAKNLKYAGNIECLGGIILENADRSVSINSTFDVILEKIKQKSLKEISKILFGK